jgi:hypothetical protein
MEEKLIDLMWEVKEGRKHPNRAYKELCVLFSVSKKLCDCESHKYVLNEVKQELMCKCGKRFNVC